MMKNFLRRIKGAFELLNRYHCWRRMCCQWRQRNKHNGTVAPTFLFEHKFPMDKVHVGKGTYGRLNVIEYGNPEEELRIGNYCSIGGEVVFLLGGNHDYTSLSTFPYKARFMENGGGLPLKVKSRSRMMYGLVKGQQLCRVSSSPVEQWSQQVLSSHILQNHIAL